MPPKKAVRGKEKANIFQRIAESIRRLFRETIGELRKVTWPTRQEATNLTKIVLVVIIVVGVYFFVVDTVLTLLFNMLLGIG